MPAPRLQASIRTKLIVLTALTIAVITGVLAVYFPSLELHDLDAEQATRAQGYGELLARQLAPGLAAGDRKALQDTLDSLAVAPEIAAAVLVLQRNDRVTWLHYGEPSEWIERANAGLAERQVIAAEDRVAAIVPISPAPGGLRGTLVLELSDARIEAYESRLTWTALAVGAAAIGCGALAAFLIARTLTRRLRAMVDAVGSVAHDPEPRMVHDTSSDEIGGLGRAFNHMLTRLHDDRARVRKSVADLTAAEEQLARANRDLEQRVIARTTALSDANRQLKLEMKHRSAMEVELRQAQKLESVGRLASGIAHEINTPVQFVSDSCGFLETAGQELLAVVSRYRDVIDALDRQQLALPQAIAQCRAIDAELDLGYLAEQIPLAIERSLQGVARVSTIVRAMKDFAYPDRIEQAPADLNRAITSTLTVARHEYKYVAELETDFGELPLVICHVGELNQVVLNIVVNAAHAIEAQHRDALGKITLRTRQRDDQVQICIQDDGCGIPDSVIDKIFDPFFTTKEIGKGTGQGLAIARTVVVDKHHGKLEVDSRVGAGTTFTITLPIAGVGHARGTTQCPPLTLPPHMRG